MGTEELALNMFYQKTSFSNIRTCVSCESHIVNGTEITLESPLVRSGNVSLADKSHLKREGKYWICTFCKSSPPEDLPEVPISHIELKKFLLEDGSLFLVPNIGEIVDRADHLPPDNLTPINPTSTFVAMPSNINCLNLIENGQNLKGSNSFLIQRLVHEGEPIDSRRIGLIYESQLRKLWQAGNNKDFVTGSLANNGDVLSNVKTIKKEATVAGSDGWMKSQKDDIKFRIAQLGHFCIKIEAQLKYPGHQSVPTKLVQSGHILTTSMKGDTSGHYSLRYFVHVGHDVTIECSENCTQVPLKDYLEEHGDVQVDAGTFLSSIDQTVNAFITEIVKFEGSPIASSNYHFALKFGSENCLILEGLLWPQSFTDINLIGVQPDITNDDQVDIREGYLDVMKKTIGTTSNIRFLKAHYNADENEATKMQNLILEHQFHHCGNCSKCENVSLPSLDWCLTKRLEADPETIENVEKFKKVMIRNLLSLNVDNIMTLSTIEWLEQVWENDVDEADVIEDTYRFVLDGQEFLFKITEDLVRYVQQYEWCPFIAIYMYSLSLSSRQDIVLIQRLHIKDVYTSPYILMYLKALRTPIKVELLSPAKGYIDTTEGPDYLSCYQYGLHSHMRVSIAEAFKLFDPVKCKGRSSSTTEFVFTGPSPKMLLKKVQEWNDRCIQVEGQAGFYEIQKTCLDRYFERINGRQLLAVEFIVWYDFMGRDESTPKFELYSDRVEKIPVSTNKCLLSSQDFLPQYILVRNGDVMQLRRNPKILKHIEFNRDTYDFKYHSVILYTMIENYDDMKDRHFVEERFESRSENNEDKIVEVNRKLFLEMARSISNN